MKHLVYFIMAALTVVFTACSDDNDFTPAQPTDAGTFTDARDGHTYHYVTYGNLDWSAENLAYDLGNKDLCYAYQSAEASSAGVYSTDLVSKYGYLYTYSGAMQAVPDGWRLPTDAEWTAFEATHGFLSDAFGLLYGGYYTKNVVGGTSGSRFKASWAYFWSSTKDESKTGEYYFFRKLFYTHKSMKRESMEPEANFLSVRFVRQHGNGE